MCIAGNTKNIQYHEWIGYKHKKGDNSKAVKFLQKIYENKKQDEIDMMAKLSTKKELMALAKDFGIDEVKL